MKEEIKEFTKAMYNIAKEEFLPEMEIRAKSFKDRIVNDILSRIPDNIEFPINQTIKDFKTEVRSITRTPEPHQRKIVVEVVNTTEKERYLFKN